MRINNSGDNLELMAAAQAAMQYAYAPYSHFAVGAAVRTADGTVYTGCNIENASFGATNCAERTAIYKAVSEGHTDFTGIAISSAAGGLTPPCGICRQVMAEFMQEDTPVILEDARGLCEYHLSDLFPVRFHFE